MTINDSPLTTSIAHILTGSNMGNPELMLQQAAEAIVQDGLGKIIATSSLYQTAAWGKQDQPNFLNQALRLETTLSPDNLLSGLLAIEIRMGRERIKKNDPRIIDLDILFYNNLVLQSEHLTLPHPLLHLRRFVLVPLNEIASELVHPVLQQSVAGLLKYCPDLLHVNKFSVAR